MWGLRGFLLRPERSGEWWWRSRRVMEAGYGWLCALGMDMSEHGGREREEGSR